MSVRIEGKDYGLSSETFQRSRRVAGVQLIEVTQKLSQGMSGGPLLAGKAVAGIVHKGGPNEGRDFAIHIEVLRAWLAE